jgi:hypothetical protein
VEEETKRESGWQDVSMMWSHGSGWSRSKEKEGVHLEFRTMEITKVAHSEQAAMAQSPMMVQLQHKNKTRRCDGLRFQP